MIMLNNIYANKNLQSSIFYIQNMDGMQSTSKSY